MAITKNEFEHFLRTEAYDYIEKPEEYCNNKIDDDHDGYIDDDDDDCYLDKYECEYKGGFDTECKPHCEADEVEIKDWNCGSGEQCCGNKNIMITYQHYVEHLYGEGLIVMLTEEFREKSGEYVVAFSSDTSSILTDILNLEPTYRNIIGPIIELLKNKPDSQIIYVARYEDLKDHCNIWKE